MVGELGRRAWSGRSIALAVATMAALAGAACSGGGPDEAAAGDEAAAALSLSLEQDRATARRAVLSPADVPRLPLAGPSAYDRLYAQCGVNPLLPGGDDPRQPPPAGFLKDGTAVASYSVLAPNEQVAKVVVATLRSPEFRTCLQRELRAAVNGSAGRQVVQAAATTELATPVLGDEAVAFRATLSGPGGVHQTFDLTTVRKGRALASVTTGRTGTAAFPDEERIRLARLVAARMG